MVHFNIFPIEGYKSGFVHVLSHMTRIDPNLLGHPMLDTCWTLCEPEVEKGSEDHNKQIGKKM